MSHLSMETLDDLRDPVLIAAFAGWNDAGEAATAATRWLARRLPARKVGRIDPEDFHVFTETRPTSRFVGGERRILWPAHDLFLARNTTRPRDLLLLIAREPELRWRTYCDLVFDAVQQTGARAVLTLGALLADAPHSRPVPISGFATDGDWWMKLRDQSISPSDYEGPTGIIGVLHDRCREADIPSASLWASVPHYLPTTANPKAALALLRHVDQLLGLNLDLSRLEKAAAYFVRQVNEAAARDRRFAGYLRELERRAEGALPEPEAEPPEPLPSAEEVIRDLEDFLRGRSTE